MGGTRILVQHQRSKPCLARSSKFAGGLIIFLTAGVLAFASDFKDVDIPSGTKAFKLEWSKDSYGGKCTIHNNSTGTIKVRHALLDCGRIDIGANCEVEIEIGDDVEGTIHVGPNSKVKIHVADSVDRGGKVVYYPGKKVSHPCTY